jgi:hypothetical protein
MAFSDILSDLGGFYRDIEVAKQSSNGVSDLQSRPESVPDQNSVGVPSPAGPNNNVNVLGMQMNANILIVTVVIIGGLIVLRGRR